MKISARYATCFTLLASLLLLLAGCAKFPGNGAAGANTQVRFSMTVAGKIKPNYIYVVAIRWAKDNPPFDKDRGPIPVIAAPWGNGMVAGRANVFMKWDAFQSPEYQLFEFTDPIPDNQFPVDGQAYLTQFALKSIPLNVRDVGENDRTIEFTLDLSQIAQNSGDIPLLRNLQVNFLTMDRVPQGNDTGSKFWDGIGDNDSVFDVGNFLTVSLDQNNTYSNTQGQYQGVETQNDVPDPDLDIVDWQIQVTRP
ncbi:MAG TPA: hypothetical protein VJ835_05785 [Fimbriimonadaceae bacterium]|nr:hypothetical protein [Fimbriimonadaceae bacterium]